MTPISYEGLIRMSFLDTSRIGFKKFLPVGASGNSGQRIGHLVVMAERNGKGICRIKVLGVKVNLESLLNHHADLLLGSRSVAAYSNLGLSRSIFCHWYPAYGRRQPLWQHPAHVRALG